VIILVLTAVPPGLRGDLSRWLTEVSPGVFCGRVSRRVRDLLWERVRAGLRGGSAVLVAASGDQEQGYEILTCGRDRWVPDDYDGLTLIRKPPRARGGTAGGGPAAGRRGTRRGGHGRPWTRVWKRIRFGPRRAR